MTKKTNRNPMTIHGDRGYGYQVVVSENLEWVCCCDQGHQEAKSHETTEQMQRKRTGPRAPRAGRSEGKSGETT